MDGDGEIATTRALTVQTGVTRVEFEEFKEGNRAYCQATQQTTIAKIEGLRNLFIGAIGLSTAIITIWMYVLNAGAL